MSSANNPNNRNNPSKEILANDEAPPYNPDQPGSTSANTPPPTTSTTSTTTPRPTGWSIVPPSGFFGSFQEAMLSGAIPETLSSARWSDNAKGFPQQTFLGASIRSFNMNGGFGDNSSSLTADLIVDEYNPSDRTPPGKGDDVYHSGVITVRDSNGLPKSIGDNFVPPIPGSPVFFKFGPNFATVEEAYRKTFDDFYYYNTMQKVEKPIGGGVTISGILAGSVNIPPNSYIDLDMKDFVDGGVPLNQLQTRPIVNYSQVLNNELARGKDHTVFGGILQTYTQSRSPAGNPLYTVNVVDPREILSNTVVILNNYSGPTYGQQNMLNVYGFLEYNPTEKTLAEISGVMPFTNILKREVQKSGPDMGVAILTGDDKYYKQEPRSLKEIGVTIQNTRNEISKVKRLISEHRRVGDFAGANAGYERLLVLSNLLISLNTQLENLIDASRPFFPMTGTGFSRRSSQGIPYYRIKDAINALMENYTPLPPEYKAQGFGGRINFRGYNYVIDFGTLPDLPEFYFMDFDQINLLELALEVCDVTNKDLFVSLLPVIDHPACKRLYDYNKSLSSTPLGGLLPPNVILPEDSLGNLIAGIIRLDTIDRSEQPFYGAVKTYIDNLAANKIYVESQDLGYELSNVVTDKFIVGAAHTGSYFFSTNSDRDGLAYRKTGRNGVFPNKPAGYQWTLQASLEQQVLPYYGMLGMNAVSIPKGFGSYQQILLDARHLNAAGVGAYYVATELELRCALVSFDRWKEFLKMYNEVYMDSIESDDDADRAMAGLTAAPVGPNQPPAPPVNISTNYAVTVPRSVFDTYALPVNGRLYGDDDLPLSPCNPPYGYPLYYKRMTKIGIPEGGLTDLYNRWITLHTDLATIQTANARNVAGLLNTQYKRLRDLSVNRPLSDFEQKYFDEIERALRSPNPQGTIFNSIGRLENIVRGQATNTFAMYPALLKKNTQNALKIYDFLRQVAQECLGKKFLVKIPTKVNVFFENEIRVSDPQIQEYIQGPFGLPPRPANSIPGYEFTQEFKEEVRRARTKEPPNINIIQSSLNEEEEPRASQFSGGLRVNYNPISQKYESNYTPSNLGGYFDFDLYQNTLGASQVRDMARVNFNNLPSGVKQGLIPQDMTNFINTDGRVSAYARFDHAEQLTLEGFNDGDFTQQYIVGNSMIPDLSNALDNTGPDEFHSFPNTDADTPDNNGQPKPQQVVFVKCNVDEKLYLTPKFVEREVQVHGQQVKDIGTRSIPNTLFIPCSGLEGGKFVPGTGVYLDSYSFYKANFIPLPVAGQKVKILDFARHNPYLDLPGGQRLNNSEYVNSEEEQLSTSHAYALITLPNRVVANKDSRLRDGPFQSIDAEKFKHLMTMDVVRDLPGFQLPTNPPVRPPWGNLRPADIPVSQDNKIHAWFAMKKSLQGFSFGSPHVANFTMPSPVYPDLVSLSLTSSDRCYGPWVSSQLDGQAFVLANIGGRVEFIQDENLAPWNYGGYYLLNEAGRLQAEFSNSLLLFSERGAFTVPTIPQGNSLCKELINGGPLVTSISVDVSTGGAKTTYQMDLYTASFGKLQKQKQEEVSKISRERKKLTSERNALIRKGLGKNQSARNFGAEYSAMSAGQALGPNELGLGMANAFTSVTASVGSNQRNRWTPGMQSFGSSDGSSDNVMKVNERYTTGSLQDATQMGKTAQMFNDQFDLAKNYHNSASRDLFGENGIFTPMSHGYHANMPYRPNSTIEATTDLYFLDDEDLNNDFRNDIVKYGDNA
jgi:hypothetical protein